MSGVAYNPVILVGSLRKPDIRQRFEESLGRIPDLAIVVGGRSGGRTHEECAAAIAANIPLLPIAFTGGVAAEVTPALNTEAQAMLPDMRMGEGRVDALAVKLSAVIGAQLGAA
ncbi:hypothetical protein [Paraburkholderia sp. BR10882]|uniref:hypothetical protein n=1 Tax=unclassified Paraburkholderia TaxID=2615204 RepID=UPI0034CD9E74